MTRVALLALVLVLLPVRTGEGGPYDDYQKLTAAEKRLVLRYFWQVNDVRRATEVARARSERAFPQLAGQYDPRDAMRHALWNAAMTARLRSKEAAKRWGDAHEEVPGNPAARKAMDLQNNEAGRGLAWSTRVAGRGLFARDRFAGDDGLEALVRQALAQGGLVEIEAVGGVRDPLAGRLVPTRQP